MNLYRVFSYFVSNKKNAITALVIVGFVVYFNSLFGDFVWDDKSQILYNPFVHSILNIPRFFAGGSFIDVISGQSSGLYYKPLMSTIFSFLYSLFGPKTFSFHLIQVALHILNSALLFAFLGRLMNKGLAFLLVLVFLVHPMNVEAVAYISALQDVSFFTFGMCALLLLEKNPGGRKRMYLVSGLLLLSLFSKVTGVLFILIALVYLFLFKKRYFTRYLPYFAITLVIYSFMRFIVARIRTEMIPDIPIMRTAFADRLLNIPEIIWFYIKTFFFPRDLLISQMWLVSSINFNEFYLPLLGVLFFFIVLFGFGIHLLRKRGNSFQAFTLFFLWLIIGLGLHLQIVPLDFTVAERWFYFPMAGLLGTIGVFLSSLGVRSEKFKTAGLIAFLPVVIILSSRTIVRNSNWKDDFTLFSHDIIISEPNYLIENFLGSEFHIRGDYEKAQAHYERSFELNPWGVPMLYNLGNLHEEKGELDKALEYYKKFNEINSAAIGYQSYAKLLLTYKGDNEYAKEVLDEAVQRHPGDANLWLLLAIAEYKLGNRTDALIATQRSNTLRPNPQTQYIYSAILNNESVEFNP